MSHTFRILHFRDQADLCKVRDIPVYTTATSQTSDLLYQGRRHQFMILAALFNLRRTLADVSECAWWDCEMTYGLQDSPVLGGEIAQSACVELHVMARMRSGGEGEDGATVDFACD